MHCDLFSLPRLELQRYLSQLGIPAIHGDTVFRDLYRSYGQNPWEAPSLPKNLVQRLPESLTTNLPAIERCEQSSYDGSAKLLLKLADGQLVEAVVMPESKRTTMCISSQVGCRQACAFCHTGRMGLIRNLSAGEIVAQVVVGNRWIAENQTWLKRFFPERHEFRINNVVFMGMGEPLDNVDNVATAITILTDDLGLKVPFRRVSVSTSGHVEGLRRLVAHHPKVRLALSLHGTKDSERTRIMPINRRWPLEELLGTLRQINQDQGHPLLIQYTLIQGLNDSVDHAKRLIELTEGIDVKINLIPFNEFGQSQFRAPLPESVEAFRNTIHQGGLRVMIRYSKGQDIAAACGQLYQNSQAQA